MRWDAMMLTTALTIATALAAADADARGRATYYRKNVQRPAAATTRVVVVPVRSNLPVPPPSFEERWSGLAWDGE